MRPRNIENRDLPPGMVRRKRYRKNGKVWVGYYYRDATGKEIALGSDLSKARLKRAELEAKEKPLDLTVMKGIFDRYERDVIPKKGERTQKDNLAELKQ
ncbi:phage integrase Arm DNA-binding domain-containing protein, partial [Pseudomonas sp.]|uniref:phage integrase Arm DNA-binding domain-containing protein n=1 Tax=Pseudomonas sp. TaxID=306 RepID=UPI003D700A62